ncbi:MAG: helicase HerA domain-containing protein [Candidatus Odinarchaeota archaeon]
MKLQVIELAKKSLKLFTEKEILIDDLLCRFIALLGVRGSGKTNTSAVLAEEFLKLGLGLTIIDIEGEYWSLQEKFEILVAGGGPRSNVQVDLDHAEELAKIVLERNVPIILDLSGFLKEEMTQFLLDYLKTMWVLEHDFRTPHMIFIEEAHEFIPQGISTDLKEVAIRIALRGRKWGLGAVVISQRSAKVDKNALTQAEVLFLHRVVHPADFGVYSDLLAKTKSEVKEEIPGLADGEVYYRLGRESQRLQIRKRETFHAGFTPGLDQIIETPPLKKISDELVTIFKNVTERKKKRADELSKLQKQLKRREAELAEFQKRINDLEQQLEIASRFKVEVKLPSTQTIQKAVIEQLQTHGILSEPSFSNTNRLDENQSNNGSNGITYDELGEPYRRHLERIKKVIEKSSSLHFKLLDFLDDRYPSKYNTQQLAGWVGVQYSTLKSNPPKLLLHLGLLKRETGERGMFFYRSAIGSYLKNQFELYQPDLTDEEFQILLTEFKNWVRKQAE